MDWTIEEIEFNFCQAQEIFLFLQVSRLVLGPTQSHILWVSGVKHLVPKLRMSKVVLTLPHISL